MDNEKGKLYGIELPECKKYYMKKNHAELKELVRQKYGEIAQSDKEKNQSTCCGSGCCSFEVNDIMNEDYSGLKGYNQEADLGLGCGLPTQFAKIRPGDVVIDLGSGAGNDCFVARAETGDTGKVIGIDCTREMIKRARQNADKLGFRNVEFRQGDIEDLPLADNMADVIISNCVLNLVPDKNAAFSEIFRVLKPGGHFSISDVVLEGELPDPLKEAAELYIGCIAGALPVSEYLETISSAGFKNITVQKKKAIHIPEEFLVKFMPSESARDFGVEGMGIFSITVFGEKLAESCCEPGCCL